MDSYEEMINEENWKNRTIITDIVNIFKNNNSAADKKAKMIEHILVNNGLLKNEVCN